MVSQLWQIAKHSSQMTLKKFPRKRSSCFDCNRMLIMLFRRRFLWLGVLVTILLTYYLITKKLTASQPNALESDGSGMHLGLQGSSKTSSPRQPRIQTITGRSYESKISRLKVYRCNTSKVPHDTPRRPLPSDIRWNNHRWQNPAGTGLFLYSAYYDSRIRRVYRDRHCFVRILAMHDGDVDQAYYCQIWFQNISRPIVIDADFTEIWFSEWDNGSKRRNYKPYIISCTLPRRFGKISLIRASDVSVSIATKPCVNATTLQEARYQPASLGLKKSLVPQFAVCVKPLDFDKDLSSQLVEWLEANFILGASKVYVYTFRVHPNVEKVLSYYARRGQVEVVAMTLPGNQPNLPVERTQFLQRNLWQKRRNELIPYNDCLYRNLHVFDYVIPLDIDELLVPKAHATWPELFAHVQKSDPDKLKTYASFSVRNVYYLEEFGGGDLSGTAAAINASDLYLLRNVYRSANFSDASKSVKSFVRIDKTLSVFNHYTLETVIQGVGRSTVLPVDLIQMNHYRKKCPPTMSSECKNNFLKYKTKDAIMWKYKVQLEKAVFDTLMAIGMNKDKT